MSTTTVIPGMETATSGADVAVWRSAANVWWIVFGDAAALREADVAGAVRMPSQVITTMANRVAASSASQAATPRPITLAKVELDVCGAWITVANASPARPLVLRRARWVDVRGHPGEPLGTGSPYRPADDRVGLGPGDAFILQPSPLTGIGERLEDPDDEAMLDALVAVAGAPPTVVLEALDSFAVRRRRALVPAAVIAVPADLGTDPNERVSRATGLPMDDLALPGYPLGDLQPELWRQPPEPPRLARLRLTTDLSTPRAVRQLLDRLLASWRLDERLDEQGVMLAASELATNAVIHSGTPRAATIRYLGSVVRVEIDDESSTIPAPRDPDDGGGRGLPLVDAVSSAWGIDERPTGKRVWFEVEVVAPPVIHH